jgi:hypothetical protein
VAATAGNFCGAFTFNFFDGGLCDAVTGLLTGLLASVFAAVRPVPVPDFLADVFDAVLEGVLEDFLRVFLDIRLPFVAFNGSIIALLRVRRWNRPRWANLPISEYGYNGFCATLGPHPIENTLGVG